MCCRGRQENLCIQGCAVGVLQRPGSARAFGVTADDSWANRTPSGSPADYRAGSRNRRSCRGATSVWSETGRDRRAVFGNLEAAGFRINVLGI